MSETATTSVVKKSVSFPPDLLKQAEKRAAQDQRSFSNYLQLLVANDVRESMKRQAEALMSPEPPARDEAQRELLEAGK